MSDMIIDAPENLVGLVYVTRDEEGGVGSQWFRVLQRHGELVVPLERRVTAISLRFLADALDKQAAELEAAAGGVS